jgi:RHS repeat-associated protein
VGSTLDVTLPSQGLTGKNLTFTITPQPLPANMTFDRGTGELVFAPAPNEVGNYSFTVTVSNGVTSTPLLVPITVSYPRTPTTEVSGQVVDVSGRALAGVPVMIGKSMTLTDAAGRFTLQNVPAQPGPLAVDGYHADAAGDYLMLMGPSAQIVGHSVYARVDNVILKPLVLPHIDLPNATDFSKIDPSQPHDLTSPLLPGVTLHVPADSAMTLDGKPFSGKIALTALPADLLREVLPPGVFPGGSFVGIDGPELMFKTQAQITLPNSQGFPVGAVLNLMSMSMTTGAFEVTGHLVVSPDGKSLIPRDGGLNGSSCIIPVPLQDGNGLPITNDICDCGQPTATQAGAPANSDIGLVSGEYFQDHALASYQSQEKAQGLDFQYSSLQADPRPVVQVEPSTQAYSESTTLQSIRAQLSLAGVTQGSPVIYEPPVATDGETFRVPIQADATQLATGRYPYTMTVTNYYPGGITLDAAYNSGINVVNRSSSPLGSGWSIGGLQQVYAGPTGAVVTDGSKGSDFFTLAAAAPIQDLAAVNSTYYQPSIARVFTNNGAGSFTVPATGFNQQGGVIYAAVAGDFNGDGSPDLAEAFGGGIRILQGDGTGAFTLASTYSLPVAAVAIVSGNFFGHTNGTLDLAVLRTDDKISTFRGNGDGTCGSEVDTDLGDLSLFRPAATSLAAGDFNGDGLTDLAVASSNDHPNPSALRVLLSNGAGGFGPPTVFSYPSDIARVVAGHFTGSPYLDLALGTPDDEKTYMLVGGPNGFSRGGSIVPYGYGYFPSGFAAGDFYGTGRDDLAFFVPDVGIVIVTGQSDGSWGPYVGYPVNHSVRYTSVAQLFAGDFNGDGKASLALTEDVNPVQILLSNPNANQMEPVYDLPGDSNGVHIALASPLTRRSLPQRYVAPMGDTSTLTHNPNGTWTRAYSDGMVLQFDSSGLETSATDRNGNTTTYTYVTSGPAAGALQTVTDPVGLRTILSYDGGGHLQSVTDPANRVTLFTVDASGNLTQVVDPDGAVTHYGYTIPTNHRITTETNPDSKTATVTYDDFGRVTSEVLFGNLGTVHVSAAEEQGLLPPGGIGPLPTPSEYRGIVGDPNGHPTTLAFDTMDHTSVWTDANNQTTIISRDMMTGWPVAVTDPLNRTTHYIYDTRGNVVKVTRPDGTFMTTAYDPTFSQPTQVTDYLGQTTTFTLDGHGNVTRRTDPDLNHEDFTYNAAGQVLTDTDRNGHITGYSYNPLGRLTTMTFAGPSSPTVQFGYNAAGDTTSVTDEVGDTTTYTYDPLGRVLTSQDPVQAAAGVNGAYAYDPAGNLTSFTDALNHIITYVYDARNRITAMNDALNRTTSYGYDPTGNLTSVTDALEHTTTYGYDADNRLTSRTDALGNVASAAYDGAGQLIGVTDPNNNTVTYSYDVDGRLQSVTLPSTGAGTAQYLYAYDHNDNLTSITDPLNDIATYTYDSLNRQTSWSVTPDGFTQDTTAYGYDGVGNLTSVTDPVGHVTTYTYDERDRLSTQVEPSGGGTTTFAYDDHSRLHSLTDSVGNTTSYTYTGADHVATEIDPRNKVTSYVYDTVGNLTQKTDRDNRVTQYGFDADNRPTSETWVSASPAETITTAYDPAGRITGISDAYSVSSYGYDNADRMTSVDNQGTPGSPRIVLTYGYDNASNRTSLADSLGGVNSYTYDARNELTTLTQSGTGVQPKRVDFGYDQAGRMTSLVRSSNLSGGSVAATTLYGYDQADRLTSITHQNSSAATIASYAYTRDAADRLTSEARTWNGGASTDTVGYTYTDNNQVTGVSHANGMFTNESFSYDANGNRDSAGYATGTGNRLMSDGTFNYGYDDEGNLISKTTIATGAQTVYKWDFRNRLTEVDSVVGGVTTVLATYTYDALDRRIGVSEGDTTRWTVYDGMSPILDFNGSGTQTARYLNGPSPSGVDAVLARETSGGVAWYLPDRLGTIRDIVDNTGAIIDHSDYGVFGNVVAESNSSAGDAFKFAGMRYDGASGLYNDNARWYDPAAGRFVSEDPIGFLANDVDLYRYVSNDSPNAIDPSGWQAKTPPGGWSSPAGEAGYAFINSLSFGLLDMGRNYLDSFGANERLAWQNAAPGSDFNATAGAGANFPNGNPVSPEFGQNLQTVAELGGAATTPIRPGLRPVRPGSPSSPGSACNLTKTAAQLEREANLAKGIPASRLGPSGKPKIHVIDHSTRKRAEDAARQQGAGKPIHHPNDSGQPPHFHAVDAGGNKIGQQSPHNNYPYSQK